MLVEILLFCFTGRRQAAHLLASSWQLKGRSPLLDTHLKIPVGTFIAGWK